MNGLKRELGGMAGRRPAAVRLAGLLAILLTVVAAGCGGGSNASIMLQVVTANASPQCTGSGTSLSCTLDEGQQLTFDATLANDTGNKGVNWTLTGTSCAGSGCGTLTNMTPAMVTYMAPTPIGASLTATLKAVANANSGATVTITLTIEPPPTFATPAQVLPNGLNGIPYNQTLTASGGVAPLTFSISAGALPQGLTLNSAGNIVGKPSQSGTFNFTVKVTDSGTPISVTQLFSFSVSAAQPLSVQTTSLPNATTGVAYTATVAAQGGVPPMTWSIVPNMGTGLPPGFVINSTGTISGTTTTAGLFTFTAQVVDSTLPTSQTAQKSLAINVGTVPPLVITTSALGSGTTGTSYAAHLQATGGLGNLTWSVATGQLPSGLTLDPSTGDVTGTPIVADTSRFSVVVSDSETPPQQSAPEPLSIMISPGTAAADLTLLSGSYAFLFNGFDDQGSVVLAGAFTAAGAGTIAGGIQDSNRVAGVVQGASLTGTYTIGADGRGTMQLIATDSLNRMLTSNYLLVLLSDGSLRMIEDDTTPTPITGLTHGTGIIKKQTGATLTASNFSGHYAFGFSGQDLGLNPAAMVGTIFADGIGTITTGPGPGTSMVDFNDAGLFGSQLNASGTFAISGVFNRGTTSLTIPNPNSTQAQLTLGFAFYFISADDMLYISTDTTDPTHPRLGGEMLRQSSNTVFDKSALLGTSIASGVGVATGPSAKAFVGLLTAASLGNATLEFDLNSDGMVTMGTSPAGTVAGNYTVLPNGRADLTGLGGPFSVVYLTGEGQGFLMSADASAVEGVLEKQNGGPAFTAGGAPAFTSVAVQGGYTISQQPPTTNDVLSIVGQAQANGTGGVGGTLDEAGPNGTADDFVGQIISIAYGVGANGRGVLNVAGPPAGLAPQLAFYMVTPSEFRAVSIVTGDTRANAVTFEH